METHVVIFVFYDKATHKVLAERRFETDPIAPNELIFPGGKVEKDEMDDFEKALLREAKEELGVVPLTYTPLQTLQGMRPHFRLHPYVITEWEGEIPEVVLDKGNAIIWQTFEEVKASSVETRRKIIGMLEDYLKQNK